MNKDDKAACVACGDMYLKADLETRADRLYCSSCYSSEFERECTNCGDSIDIDDMHERDHDELCGQCMDEYDNEHESDTVPERSFSSKDLPEFQSTEQGSIITSTRLFSAEIECYYPSDTTLRTVAQKLPKAVGISYDGSLNGQGIEFQTPKLQGKKGEEFIRTMTKLLRDSHFTVNRSAGLHIHLDGARLMPTSRTSSYAMQLIDLWSFYVLYEDVLLSFLPPSRRANRYCNLIKNDFHLSEIQSAQNLEKLEKLWYRVNNRRTIMLKKADKYDGSRYTGVNLHSLFASGHLEIRYHSGTIDETKILEWVNLHQTIMDKAADRSLSISTAISSLVKIEDKTKHFFKALGLPERAEQYFLQRQKDFSDIVAPAEETNRDGQELFIAVDEASNLPESVFAQ